MRKLNTKRVGVAPAPRSLSSLLKKPPYVSVRHDVEAALSSAPPAHDMVGSNDGFALAFDSALSYGTTLETLNRLGSWKWHDRDCAWYGNLATCKTNSLKLAFMESGCNELAGEVEAGEGCRYAISFFLSDDGDWTAIRAAIEEDTLPAVHAHNICPTDVIDA